MKSLYAERYQEFLRRLKLARTEAGMTQQQLAIRLARPQSFVSKYENAERRLDVIEFLDVCVALEVDSAKFIKALTSTQRPMVRSRRSDV